MLAIGKRTAITPFWNRIPRFFLYPVYPAGLAVLLGLLVLFVVLPVNLIGGLARVMLGLFFIKYCFDVLAQTSDGRLQPPALTAELFREGYELPFKQFALLLVLGAANYGLAQTFGEWAAVGFSFVVQLAYPASTMVLATSGSLGAALNPATVFGLMFRVGWPYLALLGFLTLLSGGTLGLVVLLAERVSLQTLLVIAGGSFMYFTIVMFNLMGYVVYQYHEQLGLSPAQAEDAEPEDPELVQCRRFMEEQQYPAALEELRRILPGRWGELELHRLLHKLARLTGNTEVLIRHGRQYLGVLIEKSRVREAMEIYQDLVAAEPAFRPDHPEEYLPIAQMLRESRQPKAVVALINGFHKRFPRSDQTPALYLLAAKTFHDDLEADDKALQILRFVAQHYPKHALIGAVQHYLAVLEGTPANS